MSRLIWSAEKIAKFETVASTLDVNNERDAAREILRLMNEPEMTLEQVYFRLQRYRRERDEDNKALKRKINAANTSNVPPVDEQEVVVSNEPQRLPENLGLEVKSCLKKHRGAVKKTDAAYGNVQPEVVPIQAQRLPHEEVSADAATCKKPVFEFDLNQLPGHVETIQPQRLSNEANLSIPAGRLNVDPSLLSVIRRVAQKLGHLPSTQNSQPRIYPSKQFCEERPLLQRTGRNIHRLKKIDEPNDNVPPQQDEAPIDPVRPPRLPVVVPTHADGKTAYQFDLNMLPDEDGQQE